MSKLLKIVGDLETKLTKILGQQAILQEEKTNLLQQNNNLQQQLNKQQEIINSLEETYLFSIYGDDLAKI